ncbi:MAG: hypothetical protein IT320_11030 [Anaerolineae bacterium]|nr:hypothetical protein [Anaerolineae bacterium]
MRLSVALFLLIVLSFSTVFAQDEEVELPPEDLVALFDYDQSAAPDITVVSSEQRGDATVQDITYPSPVDGEPIAAYLVTPSGDGPFAGVLYVHWYEPESDLSNRGQFLDEAVTMAAEGVVSLLPATLWEDPAWYTSGRSLDTDYDDTVKQVIDLRRALDVLVAQPGVDAERIAYVGHDFGAMYGAILAGVDRRAKAYDLIAGTSDFNNWMLFGVDEGTAGLDDYKAKMAPLAPTQYVPFAAPAYVLFQFGGEDFYTPRDVIDEFSGAASGPKLSRFYLAETHAMDHRFVREDRMNFLREQLGLGD